MRHRISRAFLTGRVVTPKAFQHCEEKRAEHMGARGCGFTLQAGTVTEVMVKDGEDISIQLNGVERDAPTTEFVVTELQPSLS